MIWTDQDEDSSDPVDQHVQAARQGRPAVSRALEVLEFLVESGGTASVTDIARDLGMPKTTAHRFCGRLEEEGYIGREGTGKRYTISRRLMRIGLGIVRVSMGAGLRHRILSDLVGQIDETCNLTVLNGTEVFYLDRVETHWPLRMALEPGSRVPLHCSASGKLLLAMMPKAKRQKIVKLLRLTPCTPNTITTVAGMEAELQRIARNGYGTDNEEFLTGLIAIAVPVRDARGQVFAAVACHSPLARMSLEKAVSLLPILNQTAQAIAQTFESL